MAKETIEVLIEGGKASAAPPLGPALGPMGVNIGQVVSDINKKTADFKGMQIPVKVIIDTDTKGYEIVLGTPPASALIKKEAGIQKGAMNPLADKVADLKIQQVMKIAKMKEDALLGANLKAMMKEIIGSCQSMGVMVEGKPAHESIEEINSGKYDDIIKSGKTELTEEEKKALEEEKKHLAEETAKHRDEHMARAKQILETVKNKEDKVKRSKLKDEGIPIDIVDELVPPPKEGK